MDTRELGIIVAAHMGQKRFMKACFESCREMDPAIIVCAAEVNLSSNRQENLGEILPPYDVVALADLWFFSQFYGTVGSWAWDQKYGLALLSNNGVTDPLEDPRVMCNERIIKYIFSIEGDCVVTNPKGIHKIYDMLIDENADIISAEYRGENYAGALSYFAKMDVALKVNSHILNNRGKSFGNTEGRFGKAISEQNFKCIPVKNPDNDQFSFGQRGTWGEILGFRHLHGEEKYRMGHHVNPIEEKFYDKRFLRPLEKDVLEEFWKTGKTDHLLGMGYWRS